MSNPLAEGKFVFEGIQEGQGESRRVITFSPPLTVTYSVWEKKNEVGEDNYPEDVPIMGYVTFDFGMEMMTPLDENNNTLVNGYEGLTPTSPCEEILMRSVLYDLFHAFFHIPEDPNYNHYHWALKGWLEDRATCRDFADGESN